MNSIDTIKTYLLSSPISNVQWLNAVLYLENDNSAPIAQLVDNIAASLKAAPAKESAALASKRKKPTGKLPNKKKQKNSRKSQKSKKSKKTKGSKKSKQSKNGNDSSTESDTDNDSEEDKPVKPKRPLSAFFVYMGQRRVEVKRLHPEYGVTDIAKAIGEEWKQFTDEQKAPYIALAQARTEAASYASQPTAGTASAANYVSHDQPTAGTASAAPDAILTQKLTQSIRKVLSTTDPTTMTLFTVREQLSKEDGIDTDTVEQYRTYINRTIKECLAATPVATPVC